MDDLSQSRLTVLRSLSRCPACGSVIRAHGGNDEQASALFACAAIFDLTAGQPLTVLHPCPAPSYVAVKDLNAQAAAAVKGAA